MAKEKRQPSGETPRGEAESSPSAESVRRQIPESKLPHIQMGREQQDIALTLSETKLAEIEELQHRTRSVPAWVMKSPWRDQWHFEVLTERDFNDLNSCFSAKIVGIVNGKEPPWCNGVRDGMIPASCFDIDTGFHHPYEDRKLFLCFMTKQMRRDLDAKKTADQEKRLAGIDRATQEAGVGDGGGSGRYVTESATRMAEHYQSLPENERDAALGQQLPTDRERALAEARDAAAANAI